MMKETRAFSLLEVLVSSFIFLALICVTSWIVEFGIKAASTTNQRHNLQTAATRVILSLQNDLRRSAYASLTLARRPSMNARRDGICMAAMSDWNDPAGFNLTYGTAAYDRYVAYYATDDRIAGRLIRANFPLSGSREAFPRPLFGLKPATHFNNDPAFNAGQLGYTTLSDEVLDFTVEDTGEAQAIKISLTLHREGTRVTGARREDQSYQMQLELTPQNTWPRE